jgi:hypothetical protein
MYHDKIMATLTRLVGVSDHPFQLVRGVPGGGKTRSILKSARSGHVVLAETRATADEIGRQAAKGVLVTTIGSALINGVRKSSVLYVDEALMAHPGSVVAVSRLTRATKLHLYGDPAQIPFINRTKLSLTCTRFLSTDFAETLELDVTHRCPSDVVSLMRDVYPTWTTSSKVTSSLRKSLLGVGVEAIPSDPGLGVRKRADAPGFAFLTLTQTEKDMLQAIRRNHVVMTVHEAQGLTFTSVVLVRWNVKPSPIHENRVGFHAHMVVALTRHTHAFQYVSLAKLSDMYTDRLSVVV